MTSARGGDERLTSPVSQQGITERDDASASRRDDGATFHALIDQNPFGIYIVDAAFRMTRVSEGARRAFATVTPLLGRDFAEIVRCVWPDPFASEIIRHFRHTLATGEGHIARDTRQRGDVAEYETYDWRIERLTLPDGTQGVVCFFYDLSERTRWERALAESEARLRIAADAAALGIWSWLTTSDTVVWENTRPSEIFGLAPGDASITAARFASDFVLPQHRTAFEHALQRTVTDGAALQFEGAIRRPDGQVRWIELNGKHVVGADGASDRVVGTVQDITDRKDAESRLRETAADLQALTAQLSAADRRKDEFLATLAHELRNPLAPVRSAVSVLNSPAASTSDQQWAREVIERQMTAMTRLIDDLMDLSRITLDRIELQRSPVSLAVVLQGAVETSAPLIAERNHQLDIVLPPATICVNGDATRLTQVFLNLLNNAAKFTPPGGRITVRTAVEGTHVVTSVSDTGIGIATDQLPGMFEMFGQGDDPISRASGGLGIGLALVRRLIEKHGGDVAASSAGRGQGSAFSVRLPMLPPEPTAPASSAAQPTVSTAMARRILIVDDNRDAAEGLSLLLSLGGHETRVAFDGESAIEAARTFRPHTVLCDIGLPGRNGYDVCRALLAEAWDARLHMVAVSGWGHADALAQSRMAGFVEHLVKPVDPNALTAVLQRASPPW